MITPLPPDGQAAGCHVATGSLTRRQVDQFKGAVEAFDVDVLACTRFQGPLRLMSIITKPATVRRILEHLPPDRLLLLLLTIGDSVLDHDVWVGKLQP